MLAGEEVGSNETILTNPWSVEEGAIDKGRGQLVLYLCSVHPAILDVRLLVPISGSTASAL